VKTIQSPAVRDVLDFDPDQDEGVVLQRLVEALPAPAYTCDAEGLITWFNQHAAALWGREPKLHDPEDRFSGAARTFLRGEPIGKEDGWVAQSLREHRPILGQEIMIERPDGTRVTSLINVTPLQDETGHTIGALTVMIDISDRKRAEEALQQADRSKDMFLAKLAQEMRNQLGPARGVLQVLRDATNGAAQDQARGLLQRQIEKVAQIVDNLVDISNISRDRLALRKERVELGLVVRDAVRAIQDRGETSGHKIVVTFPNEQIFVNADTSRLGQAVWALLANAVRYTERGGRIWLIAERSGSHAVLSVRDTGIGIAPADLPQIFDMMANMGRTVGRPGSGLGIGLALVKGIVELHGGIIEARSDGPGHGSEFIVRLPVAA
jgi:PAS domain S-box-containing protein